MEWKLWSIMLWTVIGSLLPASFRQLEYWWTRKQVFNSGGRTTKNMVVKSHKWEERLTCLCGDKTHTYSYVGTQKTIPISMALWHAVLFESKVIRRSHKHLQKQSRSMASYCSPLSHFPFAPMGPTKKKFSDLPCLIVDRKILSREVVPHTWNKEHYPERPEKIWRAEPCWISPLSLLPSNLCPITFLQRGPFFIKPKHRNSFPWVLVFISGGSDIMLLS